MATVQDIPITRFDQIETKKPITPPITKFGLETGITVQPFEMDLRSVQTEDQGVMNQTLGTLITYTIGIRC